MTKSQLNKEIEQLTAQNILKEFTTRFQSINTYRQYYIMNNENATLVVIHGLIDLIDLETEHGTIQVYLKHLHRIKYHFITDTVGMVSLESKFNGRNRDYFTTQSLTIAHKSGL